ncbi:hypothetical protein ACPW7J_11045 [Ihubacter sp. rT4E-8]|uniref:hypothetical protein n=1 Tax=unclassified Ihubacter TaxID=2633299 RepID=UPI003C7E0824
MTINGGTITGQNGVQFTGAGNLTVTGGNITSTLEYTESPQKPPTHTDGTVADGAALSMVSRGSGWQKDGETMNVTISGGYFTSLNNSAVAVYRIKQQADKTWEVGDDTGLPSYLKNLTITGGTFTGNVQQKDVLYIDHLADDAVSISGGYFNQDIDDTEEVDTVYVTEGYASHTVNEPANYFHVHQPKGFIYFHDATHHRKGCEGNQNCIEGKLKETHNWNDGVVTTWPTYTSEGVRTFTCVTCGHTKTAQIPRVIDTSGTVIPDPNVPLGLGPDNPDNPDTPDNPIIDDPDVPLAPNPDEQLPSDETLIDDPQMGWVVVMISGIGLLWMILTEKKRMRSKN